MLHDEDIIARLASQGAPESQLRRMSELIELCRESPDCQALALVGSFAQGKGDRISDLDLAAFIPDSQAPDFIGKVDTVLFRADVMHAYGVNRPGVVIFKKYVYLDFTSCEFHTFCIPTAFKLRRPFLAVWDPHDFLQTLVVDEAPPRHEDFEAYPNGDDGLIWELMDCVTWLRRGRTKLAKDYLRKLVAAIDASTK